MNPSIKFVFEYKSPTSRQSDEFIFKCTTTVELDLNTHYNLRIQLETPAVIKEAFRQPEQYAVPSCLRAENRSLHVSAARRQKQNHTAATSRHPLTHSLIHSDSSTKNSLTTSSNDPPQASCQRATDLGRVSCRSLHSDGGGSEAGSSTRLLADGGDELVADVGLQV